MQAWDALEPDARKNREEQLAQDEKYAPGYNKMVSELMFLLKTMTATIAEVFVQPQVASQVRWV